MYIFLKIFLNLKIPYLARKQRARSVAHIARHEWVILTPGHIRNTEVHVGCGRGAVAEHD